MKTPVKHNKNQKLRAQCGQHLQLGLEHSVTLVTDKSGRKLAYRMELTAVKCLLSNEERERVEPC